MKLSTRVITATIATAFAFLPLVVAPAEAADSPIVVTWGVRPSSAAGDNSRSAFAYSVKPGVEIQDYVAISNAGTQTTTFNTYATGAIDDPKTGAFSLLSGAQARTDLGSWIRLPEQTITIQPGKEARIPVTILIPSDATPGDHTAGIIASIYRASTAINGKHIRVEERVAARVYVHVDGAVAARVAVSGLTSGFAPSLNPFGGGTENVSYAVTNTGNLRVDVQQKITITGPFGIVLGHIQGPVVRNILPGQAVQQQLHADGIPPLLLVWASVSLTTSAPTDTVVAGKILTDAGTVAAPIAKPKYPSFSSDTLTGAVPWALLILLLIVALGIWILVRYLAVSRDRVFLAIDAAAEDARRDALAEHAKTAKNDMREKEPVA